MKNINTLKNISLNNNFNKFIIIWLLSTIINYLFFYILIQIWFIYLISSWTWYIIWLLLWYILNSIYNFKKKINRVMLIRYFIVYFINLIIQIGLLYIIVEYLWINVYIGNFLVLIYTTIWNYLWIKYFTFRN